MRNDPGSIVYEVMRTRQRSHSVMDWIRFLVDRYHSWSRRDMMHKALRAGLFMLLAFIVVVELLALSVAAKVSGLERIHVDLDGSYYINSGTMVNPAGSKISFWSTVVPVKGGDYYTRSITVLQKARKDPNKLEYVQALQEVDCTTGKITTSNILFYDKKDRIVHSVNVPGWAQQIEASRPEADRLLAAVCGPMIAQVTGE